MVDKEEAKYKQCTSVKKSTPKIEASLKCDKQRKFHDDIFVVKIGNKTLKAF